MPTNRYGGTGPRLHGDGVLCSHRASAPPWTTPWRHRASRPRPVARPTTRVALRWQVGAGLTASARFALARDATYLPRMLWRAPVARLRPQGFIAPCVPTLATKPLVGPQWVHEIKHDGYRLIVCRRDRRVRLFTRRGAGQAVRGLRYGSTGQVVAPRPSCAQKKALATEGVAQGSGADKQQAFRVHVGPPALLIGVTLSQFGPCRRISLPSGLAVWRQGFATDS